MESQVISYTAEQVSSLLGIPNTCTVPMPDTSSLKPGEILLWYPGCTLTQLRDSPLGKERMWQNEDCNSKKTSLAEPGYYAVQLRFPGSNGKNWEEQQAVLFGTEQSYKPAPAEVAATTLLVHLQETGNDLLDDDWCRCVEKDAQGYRVALTAPERRMDVVNRWDGARCISLWLAVARKL